LERDSAQDLVPEVEMDCKTAPTMAAILAALLLQLLAQRLAQVTVVDCYGSYKP
jgi:hypothetical protein